MNKRDLYDELVHQLSDEEVLIDEPMKKSTSFKIGGPADFFIKPESKNHLIEAIRILNKHKMPKYVIGNGSNLLVADDGFRGAVIQIYKNFDSVEVDGNIVRSEAGVLLSKLANIIYDNELTGFEFASGIPGTLGGAVYMNAGAYGGEIKHVIEEVEAITEDGNIILIDKMDLELGYRTSVLQQKKYVALGAKLKFKKGVKQEIKALMNDLNNRRKLKQPLNMPSAGSTFKRPEGYYAGKLIMDADLKGFSIGGARVSEKHCGFIVNEGNATCKDVLLLIKHIKKVVKDKFGVELEPEVRLLGDIR